MASVIAFLKSLFQKLIALFSKKKGEEVVDYYGCPNSKKTQKLQLKKNKIPSFLISCYTLHEIKQGNESQPRTEKVAAVFLQHRPFGKLFC